MPISETASKPSLLAVDAPQAHVTQDACPLCDQVIPHDRADEIKERIRVRERQQQVTLTARLREQFDLEKAKAVEQAQAEATERERKEAAAQIVAVREKERLAAEAAARDKLAAVEQAGQEAQTALKVRLEQVEAAKSEADQARATLESQVEQVRLDGLASIEKVKQEAEAREAAIRQEALLSAEASLKETIEASERARTEAETKAAASAGEVALLKQQHESEVARRVQEVREVMERSQTAAVNAEKANAFEEKQKLSAKVDELQRSLDKKTAEELGEGAEVDLFEQLKAEFEGDRIERVKKGQSGADIIHVVRHNGKECGTIIYDSKNHNAWRSDFVTKLATDQMAAKAEHAILSTRKFPANARQVHHQDGVIVCNPARVIAIVQIVRQHLIRTHTLRLSNEARTQKTAALYSFITSERCSELFKRFDTHADSLLELQAKEIKAHEATWKKQGELLRSVQKVRAEICNEIDAIIGTAEDLELMLDEQA